MIWKNPVLTGFFYLRFKKNYSTVPHGNITPDETTVYVIMFHKKILVSTDMKKSYRGRDFNVLEIFAILKHP